MPQPKNSKKGIYAKYQEYILEIKIQKVHLWPAIEWSILSPYHNGNMHIYTTT